MQVRLWNVIKHARLSALYLSAFQSSRAGSLTISTIFLRKFFVQGCTGKFITLEERCILRSFIVATASLRQSLNTIGVYAMHLTRSLAPCVPEPWGGVRYHALSMAVATRNAAIPTMHLMPCIQNARLRAEYWKTSAANWCRTSSRASDNLKRNRQLTKWAKYTHNLQQKVAKNSKTVKKRGKNAYFFKLYLLK